MLTKLADCNGQIFQYLEASSILISTVIKSSIHLKDQKMDKKEEERYLQLNADTMYFSIQKMNIYTIKVYTVKISVLLTFTAGFHNMQIVSIKVRFGFSGCSITTSSSRPHSKQHGTRWWRWSNTVLNILSYCWQISQILLSFVQATYKVM